MDRLINNEHNPYTSVQLVQFLDQYSEFSLGCSFSFICDTPASRTIGSHAIFPLPVSPFKRTV